MKLTIILDSIFISKLVLLLFLFYIFSYLRIEEVSVNVWSGYECIRKRVSLLGETWFREFPEINVFVDKIGKNQKYIGKTFPKKVKFIELGNLAKYLFIPTAWERAQPRFLYAMHESFVMNSSKKWYIFCDDDTYLVRDNLMKIMSKFDPNEKIVIGHFYCAWPDVVFGKNHNMECLSFPQGGAGIIISHAMMEEMKDHFLDCNNKYNDRNYAGSMRFAKCVQDHITDGSWTFKKGIQNFQSHMNSMHPIDEIENSMCTKKPATFHQIKNKEFFFVQNGLISEWSNQFTGKKYYTKWSNFTCKIIPIYITSIFERLDLRFGYAITDEFQHKVIAKATSRIIPIFQNQSQNCYEKPTGYIQKFENNVSIHVICSEEEVYKMEYLNTTFENGTYNFYLRMNCPEVYEFSNNNLYI